MRSGELVRLHLFPLVPALSWLVVRALGLGHAWQVVALAGGALAGAIGVLAWIDGRSPRASPVRGRQPLLGAPRCPYCHGDFVVQPKVEHCCLGCGTPMHAACWSEHGGCSVYGCGGRRRERALPT